MYITFIRLDSLQGFPLCFIPFEEHQLLVIKILQALYK